MLLWQSLTSVPIKFHWETTQNPFHFKIRPFPNLPLFHAVLACIRLFSAFCNLLPLSYILFLPHSQQITIHFYHSTFLKHSRTSTHKTLTEELYFPASSLKTAPHIFLTSVTTPISNIYYLPGYFCNDCYFTSPLNHAIMDIIQRILKMIGTRRRGHERI